MNIIAVSPTNIYDTDKLKYILESSKKNNFEITFIGLNKPFIYLSKILWFKEYLENMNENTNPIICFTDAYDVFYVDSLEIIKQKFLSSGANIVWSVEKWYSHQAHSNKKFYDEMANSYHYKYINSGTFMGYKNDLLCLYKNLVQYINESNYTSEGCFCVGNSSECDQSIISKHLAKNWNTYNIKLDYTCDIFYVPVGDWDNINMYMNNNLVNTSTGKKPSIIHVPWKAKYEHILVDLFNRLYHTI
jgi:hypothetical protein